MHEHTQPIYHGKVCVTCVTCVNIDIYTLYVLNHEWLDPRLENNPVRCVNNFSLFGSRKSQTGSIATNTLLVLFFFLYTTRSLPLQ